MKTAFGRLIFVLLLSHVTASCADEIIKPVESPQLQRSENFRSVFGEKFFFTGDLITSVSNLIETNTWRLRRKDKPLIMQGKYDKGFPVGDWNFMLTDAARVNFRWNKHENILTRSAFSVPFLVEENQVNDHFYKLTASCPLMGDVSVIVGVKAGAFSDQQFAQLANDIDFGLSEQGYWFSKQVDSIAGIGGIYSLKTYAITDSSLQTGSLYNISGLSCSGKNFVEISFFHTGVNEDLARLIFSLMTTSFYVGDDRFYNPFENEVK